MNMIEIKTRLRQLAAEAKSIVDDPTLTSKAKLARLGEIEPELNELASKRDLIEKSARYMTAGAMGDGDDRRGGSLLGSYGVVGGAPSLRLDETMLKALHESACRKQSIRLNAAGPALSTKSFADRITTKESPMTPASALLPPTLLPGIANIARYEPVRLLDHLPVSAMQGPSVEIIAHNATTGAAASVAEGALKPEIEFQTEKIVLAAQKIAGWCSVSDETLFDFDYFKSYISYELVKALYDAENDQVLNGNGTAPQLQGILTTSGLQNLSLAGSGAPTPIDGFEEAIASLRSGAAYVEPDLAVMHPQDWSTVRRWKDNYGRYLLSADPSKEQVDHLWGVPVVVTTTMPRGTALIGNFAQSVAAFVRQGPLIESSNSDATDFQQNIVKYRVEERLTVGVIRPAGLLMVTGIPANSN